MGCLSERARYANLGSQEESGVRRKGRSVPFPHNAPVAGYSNERPVIRLENRLPSPEHSTS